MIKKFKEAVKFLENHIPTPDKKHPGELGLERMQYLMDLLGNPQLKYPTIHVGGTSGKGSTSTFIASILAAKYKVGLHTSPHLIKINERIKILQNLKTQNLNVKTTAQISELNREITDISNDKFADLVNKVEPSIKEVEKSKYGKPSYFEIIAAVAFLYFYQQEVDFAVIEVGMGGRYDATNVVKPSVTVITNVGLDHTEILGDTVEKIARDKAGIIKPAIEVVSGVRQESVIQIIRSKIKVQRSKLSLLNRDFSYKIKRINDEGSVFDYKGNKLLENLHVKLLGEHQVENAAIALRAIELISTNLSLRGVPLSGTTKQSQMRLPRSFHSLAMTEESISSALASAFIPGRLEIIKRRPLVIFDGAHNPDKVKALKKAIKDIFPHKKITAIIAIKSDKNVNEILTQLVNICEKIIFTKFRLKGDIGIINSYNPKELLKIGKKIDGEKSMIVMSEAKGAFIESINLAKKDELILVTGSLYLVGEIKRNLKNQSSSIKSND